MDLKGKPAPEAPSTKASKIVPLFCDRVTFERFLFLVCSGAHDLESYSQCVKFLVENSYDYHNDFTPVNFGDYEVLVLMNDLKFAFIQGSHLDVTIVLRNIYKYLDHVSPK